jgi:hypothetical protein
MGNYDQRKFESTSALTLALIKVEPSKSFSHTFALVEQTSGHFFNWRWRPMFYSSNKNDQTSSQTSWTQTETVFLQLNLKQKPRNPFELSSEIILIKSQMKSRRVSSSRFLSMKLFQPPHSWFEVFVCRVEDKFGILNRFAVLLESENRKQFQFCSNILRAIARVNLQFYLRWN